MTDLHDRARQLIERLGLEPHPEGGFYREVFRSAAVVAPGDGRPDRSAMTTIYFLLTAGTHSRWHRVASDEAWHFYEGQPLELLFANPEVEAVERVVLGPVSASGFPVHVVRAGWWQAARPLGGYALVGCTVAPGFSFDDFSFLRDDDDAAGRLKRIAPSLGELL